MGLFCQIKKTAVMGGNRVLIGARTAAFPPNRYVMQIGATNDACGGLLITGEATCSQAQGSGEPEGGISGATHKRLPATGAPPRPPSLPPSIPFTGGGCRSDPLPAHVPPRVPESAPGPAESRRGALPWPASGDNLSSWQRSGLRV